MSIWSPHFSWDTHSVLTSLHAICGWFLSLTSPKGILKHSRQTAGSLRPKCLPSVLYRKQVQEQWMNSQLRRDISITWIDFTLPLYICPTLRDL